MLKILFLILQIYCCKRNLSSETGYLMEEAKFLIYQGKNLDIVIEKIQSLSTNPNAHYLNILNLLIYSMKINDVLNRQKISHYLKSLHPSLSSCKDLIRQVYYFCLFSKSFDLIDSIYQNGQDDLVTEFRRYIFSVIKEMDVFSNYHLCVSLCKYTENEEYSLSFIEEFLVNHLNKKIPHKSIINSLECVFAIDFFKLKLNEKNLKSILLRLQFDQIVHLYVLLSSIYFDLLELDFFESDTLPITWMYFDIITEVIRNSQIASHLTVVNNYIGKCLEKVKKYLGFSTLHKLLDNSIRTIEIDNQENLLAFMYKLLINFNDHPKLYPDFYKLFIQLQINIDDFISFGIRMNILPFNSSITSDIKQIKKGYNTCLIYIFAADIINRKVKVDNCTFLKSRIKEFQVLLHDILFKKDYSSLLPINKDFDVEEFHNALFKFIDFWGTKSITNLYKNYYTTIYNNSELKSFNSKLEISIKNMFLLLEYKNNFNNEIVKIFFESLVNNIDISNDIYFYILKTKRFDISILYLSISVRRLVCSLDKRFAFCKNFKNILPCDTTLIIFTFLLEPKERILFKFFRNPSFELYCEFYGADKPFYKYKSLIEYELRKIDFTRENAHFNDSYTRKSFFF